MVFNKSTGIGCFPFILLLNLSASHFANLFCLFPFRLFIIPVFPTLKDGHLDLDFYYPVNTGHVELVS